MKIPCLLSILTVFLLASVHAQDAAPAASPSAAAREIAPQLINGALADADDNRMPDGWTAFPGPNGTTTSVTLPQPGVMRIQDESADAGIGIAQWVPARPGTRYRVSAEFQRRGDAFLYLVFARALPAGDHELGRHQIREDRIGVTNPPRFFRRTLEATAPEDAAYMRVWVYVGRTARADMRVRDIRLGLATLPVRESVILENPTLADTSADGLPDGWEVSHRTRTNGIAITASREGGVRLLDCVSGVSVGVAQTVPAKPGRRYEPTIRASGRGALLCRVQYLEARKVGGKPQPGKALSEFTVGLVGVGDTRTTMMRGETSPPGTAFLRISIVTPLEHSVDMVIHSVGISGSMVP